MADEHDRWESWVREHLKGRHLHEPPEQILQGARALGRLLQRPAKGSWLVDLLFDSLGQPLPAGVRSASISERRMLFSVRSDAVVGQLDLRFRREGDGTLELTGQLVPPSPGAKVHGGPRKRATKLSDSGEFVLRGINPTQRTLRLEIRPVSGTPIVLPDITLAASETEDE